MSSPSPTPIVDSPEHGPESGSQSGGGVVSQSSESSVSELSKILTVGRTALDVHVSSKKRLIEEMATLLRRDTSKLTQDDVYSALLERERLGPTGLGEGVALPHGRISGIDKPIGALATLKPAVDYESPDDEPVIICLALLVPSDATDSHVKLLSDIASRLSDRSRREKMRTASCPDDLVIHLNE